MLDAATAHLLGFPCSFTESSMETMWQTAKTLLSWAGIPDRRGHVVGVSDWLTIERVHPRSLLVLIAALMSTLDPCPPGCTFSLHRVSGVEDATIHDGVNDDLVSRVVRLLRVLTLPLR